MRLSVPYLQASAGCLLGFLSGKLPWPSGLIVANVGILGLALWIEARSVRRGW